jgi:hypothetical protein
MECTCMSIRKNTTRYYDATQKRNNPLNGEALRTLTIEILILTTVMLLQPNQI